MRPSSLQTGPLAPVEDVFGYRGQGLCAGIETRLPCPKSHPFPWGLGHLDTVPRAALTPNCPQTTAHGHCTPGRASFCRALTPSRLSFSHPRAIDRSEELQHQHQHQHQHQPAAAQGPSDTTQGSFGGTFGTDPRCPPAPAACRGAQAGAIHYRHCQNLKATTRPREYIPLQVFPSPPVYRLLTTRFPLATEQAALW